MKLIRKTIFHIRKTLKTGRIAEKTADSPLRHAKVNQDTHSF